MKILVFKNTLKFYWISNLWAFCGREIHLRILENRLKYHKWKMYQTLIFPTNSRFLKFRVFRDFLFFEILSIQDFVFFVILNIQDFERSGFWAFRILFFRDFVTMPKNFNSVIFSKSKITDLKPFYWLLKWSMFRLNRWTLSKVTPYSLGQSLSKIQKKSPTRLTWQGDYSEQARVSDLVSTPKVILGIVLSNPHIVFRIWGGRPDGVSISAGITHKEITR